MRANWMQRNILLIAFLVLFVVIQGCGPIAPFSSPRLPSCLSTSPTDRNIISRPAKNG